MKLNQYKEKKNNKKLAFVIVAIIFLIGGVILEKTFANFKVQKSFKVMEGNFIYEGSGDIIFAFYQDDKDVGTMPSKDSGYVFNSQKSSCDNDAKIIWDMNEWGPNIRNLTKTKTKCNLYFFKAGTLRQISSSDTEGMWNHKTIITKLVIEKAKNKKEASKGQIVLGPFDESAKKDSSVESYVVCDADGNNCIGYLQAEGGIDLNSNSSNLFKNFTNVTQIDGIENLYTINVVYMSSVFSKMSNLEELDISNFDTRSVKSMNSMFSYMSNLKTLTLGEMFDTSNVTDMRYMFQNMNRLQTLNLSTFNTSNVTDMNEMFLNMSSLQSLDISNFDTRNVKNMESMFYGMNNLQTLTFGENFDTSNVYDMSSMFKEMSSIQELDLSSFDTHNVGDMASMFYNAFKLRKITYSSNFIHKSNAKTSNMFWNCPANKPDINVHESWSGVSFS